MKFKLTLGRYKMTVEDVFTGEKSSFECIIGSSGNLVFTDNHGNRYIPYCSKVSAEYSDLLELMFSPSWHLVVSAAGDVYELVGVEEA